MAITTLKATTVDGRKVKTSDQWKNLEKLNAPVSYDHLKKDSELSYLRNDNHSRVNWFDTQNKNKVTTHHKLHRNQNLSLGQELSFVVIKK